MTTVRELGLLRRRYTYYWTRIGLVLAALGGVIAGFVLLGNSWFQLLMAGALALILVQVAFLSHDSAHRQIFDSAAWNDWTARLLAGGLAGMSITWWKNKHSKHHNAPNQISKDPDIGIGVIAFTPDHADSRRRGFIKWFGDRQGWLFFPLLTLEGLSLHVSSLQHLFRRGATRVERIEAAVVVSRLGLYVTALYVVLPFGKASAFLGLQLAVFGVCLGGSFAPNHKGMPLVPKTMKLDFLRRQVLMSRNIRGGRRRRLRDGRPQLPDRAPPVPEHAEADPAQGAADRSRVLRAERREVHRGRLLRVVHDHRRLPEQRRPASPRPVPVPAGEPVPRLVRQQRQGGGQCVIGRRAT